MKDLLGGKGANLAEMAGHPNLRLPVPPGFTITTEVCTYYWNNKRSYPKSLKADVETNLAKIEKITGRKFGDAKNPLLVSVRSGARSSMWAKHLSRNDEFKNKPHASVIKAALAQILNNEVSNEEIMNC